MRIITGTGVGLLSRTPKFALQYPLHSSTQNTGAAVGEMSYYPHAGTGSTYPYGTYHPTPNPAYPQAPSAYPTAAYQTGYPTTGYPSWSYSYSYFPPQQSHQQTAVAPSRPPVATHQTSATPSPSLATTATTSTALPPPRPITTNSTFTYAPSHTRESIGAGAITRSFRKQASHRGLFTKECMTYFVLTLWISK